MQTGQRVSGMFKSRHQNLREQIGFWRIGKNRAPSRKDLHHQNFGMHKRGIVSCDHRISGSGFVAFTSLNRLALPAQQRLWFKRSR